MEILRGGGLKDGIFLGVGGWFLEVFLLGAPSKIGELLKTNSCSVEQAISYFTVNRCFKTKIIVFIDHLSITVD